MSDLYKKRIIEHCSSIEDNIDNPKAQTYINLIVNFERKKCNLNLDDKKSLLIYDKNYEKLFDLSIIAYNKALKKIKNNETIDLEESKQISDTLTELYNNVYEFNKPTAEFELSEALLDLEYASSQDDSIRSLRIGSELDRINSISKH